MPTFPLGKTLSFYLNGYNFSGWHTDYNSTLKVKTLDVTTFGPSYHAQQQAGLKEAEIDLKGFYTYTVAPDATGLENVVQAALRVDSPCLEIDPGAGTVPAAGDPADLWITTAIDRKAGVQVDNVISLETKLQAKDGLHMGVAITAEAAVSGAPFTTTGYDQGGGSWVVASYTYRVQVQVTAYTSGLAALKVQTSPDNSTWTTRGTFPAITTIGGYSLALNTTLDRYLRLNDTGVATLIGAFAITY